MNRYFKMILLILLSVGIRFGIKTKPLNRKNRAQESSLYDVIRRSKIAIILLYHHEAGTENRPLNKRTCRRYCSFPSSQIEQSFEQLSKSGYYPKSAVSFVEINTAHASSAAFMQDNGLSQIRVPSVVLFSDGVPVEDQNGPIVFSGSLTRQTLKKKIDSYVHLDIAQAVAQERLCKRYEGIMRDRMHVYYSPYFSSVANPWNDYWGWPYYGMAQGNYGGNAGAVIGSGGLSFFGSNY